MRIGVPKEIKPQENRIGLTPESVKVLTLNGHKVLVQNNGGFEAGFYNNQYIKAGATIVDKAEDIFNDSEIIVKVKEPLKNEIKMIKENQIVFTYLHLAADKQLTEGLVKTKFKLGTLKEEFRAILKLFLSRLLSMSWTWSYNLLVLV